MKKMIKTTKAPEAIGPYSQAVIHNELLYTSGQIPINPESGDMINSSIAEETHQVMDNIKAILEAGGSDFSKAIKSTIFIINMDDFQIVNEIYSSYFEEGLYPARETVQVSKLPKNSRIEISMIAYIK